MSGRWVLGLDPSLVSTGMATVSGPATCSTARVESKPPRREKGDRSPVTLAERHERIAAIVNALDEHTGLAALRPRPELVVIEAPSYGSVGAGTWDRAWLWGALVDRVLGLGVPVALVPPTVRARWATGSGAGSKSMVGVHMSRMWPDLDPNISEDEWDAVCLASIGAQYIGLIPTTLERHREQLTKVAWPEGVNRG